MEKKGKINSGDNCLLITLSGVQSYVKIFSADGELLRHSASNNCTLINHICKPGEYKIETDGKIKKIESIMLNIPSDLESPAE